MKLIDITVPIHDEMTVYRGNPPVRIRPAMTLTRDGVHVSAVCLGSHTERTSMPPATSSRAVRGSTGSTSLASSVLPGSPTFVE